MKYLGDSQAPPSLVGLLPDLTMAIGVTSRAQASGNVTKYISDNTGEWRAEILPGCRVQLCVRRPGQTR